VIYGPLVASEGQRLVRDEAVDEIPGEVALVYLARRRDVTTQPFSALCQLAAESQLVGRSDVLDVSEAPKGLVKPA
jgi:hypothetical protein